ncbi:MAG: lipoyl(octanoyl) transferase LipB [Raineya sp.]|jgi:lipoyl(octanoyl) transferase|nr:lipoyl(octanoyl) transferase LipB [Raineya sp.]
MNKSVRVENLGRIDYQKAWDYQTELFDKTVQLKIQNRNNPDNEQPTPNYFLFCEHPHVYTLGKSGSIDNLLLDEQGLKEKHIGFYKINRGGDITYHGDGQIVGYPILDLDNFSPDIHKYMRSLEEVIILTLADYGIKAGRIDGFTGVWLDYDGGENPRKICAMGVKTSRWVTMHGFAFNINTDLQFFDYIVPCGISDKAVTSLDKELGRNVPLEEVQEKILKYFAQIFEAELLITENQKV